MANARSPQDRIARTKLVPRTYHACTWLQAALARISAFCFLLWRLSSFILHFWVALGRVSAFFLLPSAFPSVWLLPDDHMCPNSKHLRFVG